jgi:hypothetical protein
MAENGDEKIAVGQPSTQAIVAELRDCLDKQYQQALRALEVVERFLIKRSASTRGSDSYSQRSLEVLDDHWRTINDIARLAGVSADDVRGVLYAPRNATALERDKRDGRAIFRKRLPVETLDPAPVS